MVKKMKKIIIMVTILLALLGGVFGGTLSQSGLGFLQFGVTNVCLADGSVTFDEVTYIYVTDTDNEIQTKLDNQGTIIFTEGDYIIAQTLTLSDNIEIIGERATLSTSISFLFNNTNQTSGNYNMSISNLNLRGVWNVTTFFDFTRVYGLNMEKIDARDGEEFLLGALIQDANFVNNRIIHIHEDGIDIENTESKNINIEGNYFYNLTSDAIELSGIKQSTITNNIIDLMGSHGMFLKTIEHVTISNNVIKNTGYSPGLTQDCIAVTNKSGQPSSKYIVASNNVCFDDQAVVTTRNGILYDMVEHGTISGNVIQNVGEDGIELRDSTAIVVTGNKIVDSAIGLQDLGTNSMISGNDFEGNTINVDDSGTSATWGINRGYDFITPKKPNNNVDMNDKILYNLDDVRLDNNDKLQWVDPESTNQDVLFMHNTEGVYLQNLVTLSSALKQDIVFRVKDSLDNTDTAFTVKGGADQKVDFVYDIFGTNIDITGGNTQLLKLSQTDSNNEFIKMYNNLGNNVYEIGLDGGRNSLFKMFQDDGTTENIRLFTAGDSWITGVDFGVGTSSPARALHISDTMRLQSRSTAPTSPVIGDIYVDSDSSELCFYDGTSWTGLKSGGVCA